MDVNLFILFQYLAATALIFLLLGLIFLYATAQAPNTKRFDGERYFSDPKNNNKKWLYPSLEDEPTVDVSVIVPAYNEEERLPVMMNEAMEYMADRQKSDVLFKYEVIIVDDGSTDHTTKTALLYSERYGTEKVRVLTLEKNRGKGGAVRMGMLSARGKLLLFADADGASKFSHIEKLEDCMKKTNTEERGMAIVCGSRAHLEKESISERSLFRTILMYGFHFLVWFLCVRGVKDTQCGFKLMTRNAANLLFQNLHVDRWAFDVDMLHIAQHYQIPVGEVSISWQEIDGSKVTPFWSWLQMGRDLLIIRLRYLIGAWRMDHHLKSK